jgi:hypothetical protein
LKFPCISCLNCAIGKTGFANLLRHWKQLIGSKPVDLHSDAHVGEESDRVSVITLYHSEARSGV